MQSGARGVFAFPLAIGAARFGVLTLCTGTAPRGCRSVHRLGWVQTSHEDYAAQYWSAEEVDQARRARDDAVAGPTTWRNHVVADHDPVNDAATRGRTGGAQRGTGRSAAVVQRQVWTAPHPGWSSCVHRERPEMM